LFQALRRFLVDSGWSVRHWKRAVNAFAALREISLARIYTLLHRGQRPGQDR